jgi:hypothetical protein
MHLHSQLIAETPDSSLSVITKEGEFLCFILEDGFRAEKVMHQSRIPAGLYTIVPRRDGKFFEAHRKKWGHKFVPHIIGVPNYTFILIHPGNKVVDTSGCLITGTAAEMDRKTETFFVPGGKSEAAFLLLYNLLDQAFQDNEPVTIRISRELVMTEK